MAFKGGGKFGSKGPGKGSSTFEDEDRSRDWYCTKCGERNFAKRSACNKCQAERPKDGDAGVPRIPETGSVLTGMVKSYNRKGFGFIMCLNGNPGCQDIYYSRENLHVSLQTRDIPGEHVTFELQKFHDGKLIAKNVRPVRPVEPVQPVRKEPSRSAPSMMAPKGAGADQEDRSRDWKCENCGERNFMKRFECFKCKNRKPLGEEDRSAPAPRRTVSPHAGSRAVRDAILGKMGGTKRSRSRSGKSSRSSSSSSSKKKKKKKGKKSKKKRSSSSSSSRSSGSSKSKKEAAEGNGADAEGAEAAEANPEVDKAKAEILTKLVKLKEVEPMQARMKEYRELLRQWHPDKNPDKVEVATAVFQFLQKAKPMII